MNVDSLQKLFDAKKIKEGVVNPEALKAAGLISNLKTPVKLLGAGEIKAKFQVEVNAFSQTAKEKVEASGGTVKKI